MNSKSIISFEILKDLKGNFKLFNKYNNFFKCIFKTKKSKNLNTDSEFILKLFCFESTKRKKIFVVLILLFLRTIMQSLQHLSLYLKKGQ